MVDTERDFQQTFSYESTLTGQPRPRLDNDFQVTFEYLSNVTGTPTTVLERQFTQTLDYLSNVTGTPTTVLERQFTETFEYASDVSASPFPDKQSDFNATFNYTSTVVGDVEKLWSYIGTSSSTFDTIKIAVYNSTNCPTVYATLFALTYLNNNFPVRDYDLGYIMRVQIRTNTGTVCGSRYFRATQKNT